MLKKNAFFSVAMLLSAITFLAAPLLKTSSDSAEPTEELLCDNNVSACNGLFEINLLTASSLYQVRDDKAFLEDVVSYLAQHENSPPIAAA